MKFAYVGLAGAVMVSVGVGVWLAFFTEEVVAPVVDTSVPAVPAAATEEQSSGRATLASLRDFSEPTECTFTFTDTDSTVRGEGTGFFADGMMRVDALYTDETNAQFTSNLIVDTTTTYMWATTAEGSFALMMPNDDSVFVEEETVTNTDATPGALRPDEEVRYMCKPWQVDGSVFVPPSTIEFLDMNAMMQQMMGGITLPTVE